MGKFIVGLILILPGALLAQWQVRSPGTAKDLSSLFFLDEQKGWIVYPDSCLLTTDGGLSWQNKKVTSGNKPLYDVAFANSQRGIAVSKNDTIFRSSDGGVNWFPVDTQTDDKTYFGVAFLEDFGRHAWIVGSSETIAYSTNNGQSWTTQHSDFFSLRDAYFINKDLGWVVGANNTIWHTEDGGKNNSWVVQQRNVSSEDLLGVWFISAKIGWAVGENGLILQTIDGGQGWEPQPAGTNVTLNKVSFVDSLNGVIVGANGLILHTKDGGKTWPNEGGRIETTLKDVYYINFENAWAIGDNGTLLYSQGSVAVTSPNGGEVLEGDTRQVITWDSNYLQNVRIEFSIDNGKSYKSVAQDRDIFDATTGSYSWTVPGDVNSDSCRIRITGVTKPTVFDSSDQVFTIFRPDSVAPQISVLNILPGEPAARVDLTVHVTIVDEHPVAAFLKYRQGGSGSYKESKMARDPADSTKFEATIDGFDVTLNGIEYFIEAKDSSFNKNTSTFPDSSNPQYIEIFTDNETFAVSPSRPGKDEIYQMISIPLILDRKSISQVLEVEGVLGQYDREKWRLFRWNPVANNGNGEYQEYKGSLAETTFEPGRAFWLALADLDTLNTARGHSVDPGNSLIALNGRGWHQVANPFVYDVPVDSIKLGPTLSGFYEWDPNLGENGEFKNLVPGLASEEVLRPYKGYFINSDGEDNSLFIPPIEAQSTSVKHGEDPLSPNGWQIALRMHYQTQTVSKLTFGQSDEANNQYDRLDWLSPPLPNRLKTNSYIPHADWPTFAGHYTRDIRAAKEEGDVWDFIIESHVKGLIKLTFDLDARLSDEVEVMLLPKNTNSPHNLKAQPRYQYTSSGNSENRPFRLIVGPKEYTDQQLSATRPTDFTLFQNYPNPFNPITTIRYGLPQTQKVRLKVYNLLGQEVVTLVNDELKTAGYHVAVWDGLDKDGRAVSSGIYLYRLLVGSIVRTKKLTLLK